MTDINNFLSVVATADERLKNLEVKDGQLIFVQDKPQIAFDFNGQRIIYRQIIPLETDEMRLSLLAPIQKFFYFVEETNILWFYRNGWIALTSNSNDIFVIGTADEIPEIGQAGKLYANRTYKNISIWDNSTQKYEIVADKTESISDEVIKALFN